MSVKNEVFRYCHFDHCPNRGYLRYISGDNLNRADDFQLLNTTCYVMNKSKINDWMKNKCQNASSDGGGVDRYSHRSKLRRVTRYINWICRDCLGAPWHLRKAAAMSRNLRDSNTLSAPPDA